MTTINTLQNLSLDKIISEFRRYYKAYCYTEDSSSKLKFEFLKRKYSFDIVQKLHKEEHLETEYLDFLINKYLKVLDTRWLNEWPWERVSQRLAEIGTNLEEVTFSERPWENILCYLPNLKRVFFQVHCTDEFLANLSKFCGYIEIIDVKNSRRISDSGLQNLCCIPGKNPSTSHVSIRELFIKNTEVGDESVAYVLKNMPNLQKIDYERLPEVLHSMHKSDTNTFNKVKFYNLTQLKFTRAKESDDILNDILKVCVSVCPHLKILSCSICQKQQLDWCSQLQELEKLELQYIDMESILELNEMLTLNGKNLTSLIICNFCVSLSVLAQNCPHLKSLCMEDVDLLHNVNDSVPVFYNLEKAVFDMFDLNEPVCFQAVICLLASAPNLNYLGFLFCGVFSSDVKIQILRCCEQCKLSIMYFKFTAVDLALLRDILLTCSTLKFLRLCDYDDLAIITGDNESINELRKIASSLPNKPQVCSEPEKVKYKYDERFNM